MTNVLFGNLLAMSRGQLWSFAGLLALLTVGIGFIYRPLLFTSVNAQVAEAKGVPVRALSIIFMTLLGLTVAMAVQAVGTLLLFALVVTPAATAIMMTPRPGGAMAITTVISLLSVWFGLGLSAMLNIPPSFTIVTIACAVWFVVWILDGRVRPVVSTSDEDLQPNGLGYAWVKRRQRPFSLRECTCHIHNTPPLSTANYMKGRGPLYGHLSVP